MSEHIIEINAEKCTGCGQCVKDCPSNIIQIIEKKAVVKTQNCIKCGHCLAVCPSAAVNMSGFSQPPIELAALPRIDAQLLLQTFRASRSIRQFKAAPVPQDIILQIIEAGRWTPTAKNAKSVSFLVVEKEKSAAQAIAVNFFNTVMPPEKRANSSAQDIEIDDEFYFKGAPIAIVIKSCDTVSASLAAANMALMAQACGLGVLYSGFFTIAVNMSAPLRQLLNFGQKEKAATTLILGYSNVTYPRTTQKEPPIIDWK